MKCPNCNKKMKEIVENGTTIYVCRDKDCKDRYVVVPESIFGVR